MIQNCLSQLMAASMLSNEAIGNAISFTVSSTVYPVKVATIRGVDESYSTVLFCSSRNVIIMIIFLSLFELTDPDLSLIRMLEIFNCYRHLF